MTKQLLLGVLITFGIISQCAAQTATMKTRVTSTETIELLKVVDSLFDHTSDLSFNISTYDPLKSFNDIPDNEPYDDQYLAKQHKVLQGDTADAIALNNIANYYNFLGKTDSAAHYFRRSFNNLSIKYFNNDSAFFLSIRGTLKMNMGMEDAIADIERALVINPNDSIASAFYPMFLINTREFDKAVAYSSRNLDNAKKDPHVPFVFLIMSKMFEDFFKISGQVNDDKASEKIIATNYNKLFDFTLLDKYADKFKNDQRVQNARDFADIFTLATKLIFFPGMNKPNPVFLYTPAEKDRLLQLEKKFLSKEMSSQVNAYTRNKTLGFIYFMLQQNDKAIAYFREAIKSFDLKKARDQFNLAESYDALASIYYLMRDAANEKKILEEKIRVEPLGKKNAADYYRMGLHYLSAGDMNNARQWADKGLQADSFHFNTLRLLAHIAYLNASSAVDTYANEAAKYVRTGQEQYDLVMQFAIYQLIIGDAQNAYNNIEIGRKSLEGEPCELCDRLVEKYILVSK